MLVCSAPPSRCPERPAQLSCTKPNRFALGETDGREVTTRPDHFGIPRTRMFGNLLLKHRRRESRGFHCFRSCSLAELRIWVTVRKTTILSVLASASTLGNGCAGHTISRILAESAGTVSIIKQPISSTAMLEQGTTFRIVADGFSLHYQWRKNGIKIPSATSASYRTPPTKPQDNGAQFDVLVSNWRSTVKSQSATLRVISPKSTESATFPVNISADGKYLIDGSNKPFRIQGEAAWSLIANLTYAEAEQYLTNRRAKGFDTVLVELMEHKYAQGGKGSKFSGVPMNRAGALPFTSSSDGGAYDGTWGTANFSTPNEAYFAFADSIIDLAAQDGMLVDLAPMFLGSNGGNAGWWAELTNPVNTQNVLFNFGLYIGRRYKERKNIIWIIGGDYFPPAGSEGEARLLRFLQGIKAAGATQLWSGDWSASCLSTYETSFAPLMDINAVYTYGILGHPGATYGEARNGFALSPPHPAYIKETGYEDETWIPGDPASVRMYEYYGILGGATAGGFFGNRDVWKFATDRWWFDPDGFGHGPWTAAMESAGTFDFVYLGRLLDSVPWYKLIPSELAGSKTLVTAGGGNYGTSDYVAAAATSDGMTLLAYVPPTRKWPTEISVDMTAMSGTSQGNWYDPTSGTYIAIRDPVLRNVGIRKFAVPGGNSRGEGDWVLVLQVK